MEKEKPSLIMAMLWELPPLAVTTIETRGTVAYVSQVSCFFNATVRDSILLYKNLNQVVIGRPLKLFRCSMILNCFLAVFSLRLVKSCEHKWQRQWVSTARTVYSNSVYIFCDPTSALDAHVG